MSARPDVAAHTSAAPVDAAATSLVRLLHPLTPAEFVEHHWMRLPVHLGGWPGRLEGLFDLAGLRAAVLRQREVGLTVRVSGDHVGDDGGAGRHVPIDAGQIAEHLRGGASVCVDPVDRAVPALRRLACDLRRELGHAGDVSVKCYLSPDGYGFNTHFDAHVVTTLQVQGRKRWRFSRRPAVEHPTDNAFVDGSGRVHYMHRSPSSLRSWERVDLGDAEVEEIVLEPGDVLCLPPGTWHEAKAVGTSLALNIAFEDVDLLALLLDVAQDRLVDDPAWRAGLPAGPGDAASRDPVPPPVVSELSRQIGRLTDVLSAPAFREDVGRAWRRAVDADPVDGPVPPARPAAAVVAAAVDAVDSPTAGPSGHAGRRVQCLLPVRDVARATEWYRRVLGCRVLMTIPEFGWAELATGVDGVSIGLTESPEAAGAGPARLGMEVADLDELAAALDREGVPVEDVSRVAGVARFLRARDDDGNPLLFFRPDPPAAGGVS